MSNWWQHFLVDFIAGTSDRSNVGNEFERNCTNESRQ